MNLIDRLVNAAYDTGYYSGKKEDGQPHHTTAILLREKLRHELLDLTRQQAPQVKALVKEAEWMFRVIGAALDRSIYLPYLTHEAYEKAREAIGSAMTEAQRRAADWMPE